MRAAARTLAVVIASSCALCPLAAQAPGGDALDRAMRDELQRSMRELRLGQLDKPYFIGYRVIETNMSVAMARYGSLAGSRERRSRVLAVELRVGDYSFDNSNMFASPHLLPVDDDYLAIRREIWLATDEAYKNAVQAIASKRVARMNRQKGGSDTIADFSKEPATQTVDEQPLRPVAMTELQSLVRELSGVRELKALQSSSATITVTQTRERFLTSEGTTIVRSRSLATVGIDGGTQATDGALLQASTTMIGRTLDALPARAALVQRVRALAQDLDSLRTAPVIDRYAGPMLFEGRAAAQLFAQAFAPGLVAGRRAQMGGGGFADKLGSRVMPEWMTVSDDPTRHALGGEPLLGDYAVDEEGVPARANVVVEGGYLKTLLTTRVPVEGVERSTGNARGGGAAPSNLIVSVDSGLGDAALRRRLLALVQKRKLPYGIIVRDLDANRFTAMMQAMESGDYESLAAQSGGTALVAAYRVYPDGREERIRGARMTGVTSESFRDIIAASATPTVLHEVGSGGGLLASMTMQTSGFGGAPTPVSYAVPSLLFEDVTLAKPSGARPKPPLSEPPPM